MRLYVALGVVALVLCAAFAYYHTVLSVPPPPSITDPIAQQRYWESRIRAVGGAGAYAELAQFASNLNPSDQHLLAHDFGGALYAIVGLPGISVCDSRFSYGCYHEFIGQAIAQNGFSVINTLNSECLSSSGGGACQHGIGHGVLAYLGYQPRDIFQAVDTCSTLPGGDTIDGCYAGAFMEYDMRTLVSVEAAPRPVGSGGLFAPCNSFSGTPEESCVLLQPQWWSEVLPQSTGQNGNALFVHMGQLCDEYTGAQVQRACYEGVGEIAAALANYVPAKAISLCAAASSNAGMRLYCTSFAASVFKNVGMGTSTALATCADTTGDSRAFCDAYATSAANITHPLALPSL